jgi:hypothetical protein
MKTGPRDFVCTTEGRSRFGGGCLLWGRWRRSHGEVDLDLQTMSSVKAKTSACCKIARRHSSLRDRELSRYIFYFRSIDVIAPFRCFRIFPSAFGRPSFTFQNS